MTEPVKRYDVVVGNRLQMCDDGGLVHYCHYAAAIAEREAAELRCERLADENQRLQVIIDVQNVGLKELETERDAASKANIATNEMLDRVRGQRDKAEQERDAAQRQCDRRGDTLQRANEQYKELQRRTSREMMVLEDARDAARAECERLKNDSGILEGFRDLFRDRNPDGKTLIDFFQVWLDQERAALARANATIEKAVELLRRWRKYSPDSAIGYVTETKAFLARHDEANGAEEKAQ